MSKVDCQEICNVFSQLSFSVDIRNPPDEYRRRNFLMGWWDATENSRVYSDETLSKLTWQNLGYRMGTRLGSLAMDQVDAVYECLAKQYRAK